MLFFRNVKSMLGQPTCPGIFSGCTGCDGQDYGDNFDIDAILQLQQK